jgi:hypothetical protein
MLSAFSLLIFKSTATKSYCRNYSENLREEFQALGFSLNFRSNKTSRLVSAYPTIICGAKVPYVKVTAGEKDDTEDCVIVI